jgi:hypothetical protein
VTGQPAPMQAHHAGSLWVHDGDGWFMVLNLAGVEWSAQFAADPAKVDQLRKNAQRLYARFPETITELERLGYSEARTILGTPITDHAGVARWTDSIYNSCVMLSPGLHQGIVSDRNPDVGGWHHYPKSIWDQQVTMHADFQLWVMDDEGRRAAVAPVAPRGSGDARVHVVWAEPGSQLHLDMLASHAAGHLHILGETHPAARAAFAKQTPAAG